MITLRKLASLKDGTRQRKEVLLLKEWEEALLNAHRLDGIYLRGLIKQVGNDLQDCSFDSEEYPSEESVDQWIRLLNDYRHRLLVQLGQEPADWDFTARFDGSSKRKVLPLSIYLDDIRSPFNVGSIFRSAEALGAKEVLLSPGTASPDHPRAKRTSMGTTEILPWRVVEPMDLDPPFFALESGGIPVAEYYFPKTGTVILGSEELGVSPELLQRADESLGRVSIPLLGSKGSLNVSVAFGILMQHWVSHCIG